MGKSHIPEGLVTCTKKEEGSCSNEKGNIHVAIYLTNVLRNSQPIYDGGRKTFDTITSILPYETLVQ
jgi:hypothetical protein